VRLLAKLVCISRKGRPGGPGAALVPVGGLFLYFLYRKKVVKKSKCETRVYMWGYDTSSRQLGSGEQEDEKTLQKEDDISWWLNL
jgi:hypothetical protein